MQIVRQMRGQSGEGYGQLADVWAVGVTAYELLVGAGPFEAASKDATHDKILSCQPFLPSHLSPAAQNFIQQVSQGCCWIRLLIQPLHSRGSHRKARHAMVCACNSG